MLVFSNTNMPNWLGSIWAKLVVLPLLAVLPLGAGCGVKQFAAIQVADALSGTGDVFASDDDPQLVREALPFSLKLMESILEQTPNHVGLLTSAASSFTQYSYAFLVQDADVMEPKDLAGSQVVREQALKLLIRGRNYGLRGLEVTHRDFTKQLKANPRQAVKAVGRDEMSLLYWTAAAWGAAIANSKGDPDLVSDQVIVEALIDRAAELDPLWQNGTVYSLLISYESVRQGAATPPEERSREAFAKAVELSKGNSAGPYVSLAENVSVQKQNKAEFESLLKQALAVDVNKQPSMRLANLVMQKRARWLLSRTGDLFVE